MTDIESSLQAVAQACERLTGISRGSLRIGYGRFGPDEYKDMRRYTIYSKRVFYSMVPEWLLLKNVARRAGRFGWLWRWWVQRFDDNQPLM